ncbi:MAG: alpha/beta hydrolase [Flavobacteriales bacterium]|nr:alpha/beta hydrolase [Flavobacteriales bacterium]
MEKFSPSLSGKFGIYFFLKPYKAKIRPAELEIKELGKEDHVFINKKTCYYTVWGKGPAIIFAHGWGSKGLHFAQFVKPLVNLGYTVVIPDFPAHVQSLGKQTNVLEFKEMIEFLIEEYVIVRAIVAHSLGGLATVLALAELDVKIPKLVLSNCSIHAEQIMDEFIKQIGAGNRTKEEMMRILAERFNTSFQHFSIADRILDVKNLPELLIIADESDKQVPVSHGYELNQLVNSELFITKGYGHNNGLRSQDVINKVVDFVK